MFPIELLPPTCWQGRPGSERMTKLSIVLKKDKVLTKLCLYLPSSWPKLKRTSRLFGWRLDDTKLVPIQSQLIEELHLHDFRGGSGIRTEDKLHDLCKRGCAECAWLLLNSGMSVKLRDAEGATLLQKAVHSGKVPILQLLLERQANINAKGAYGYTPLHEACYIGHPPVCDFLLEKKGNVDALSKNGSTPLLVAAREGHHHVVASLLMAKAFADDGGDKEWTPLYSAVTEGHLEVCRLLLCHGACVNGLSNGKRFERTTLHEAADQGHEEVVALLLQHQADLHCCCQDPEDVQRKVTAFDLAQRGGHKEVHKMLLQHGVKPSRPEPQEVAIEQ